MALGKNLKKDTLIPSEKKEGKEQVKKEAPKAKNLSAEKTADKKIAKKKTTVKKTQAKKGVAKKTSSKKVSAKKVADSSTKKSAVTKDNKAPILSPAQEIAKMELEQPKEVKKEHLPVEEPSLEVIQEIVKNDEVLDTTDDPSVHEDTLVRMQKDMLQKKIGTVKYLTEEEFKERERLKAKFDEDISNYAGKDIQLITFRLGVERYAIEIDRIKEVVPTPYISKIPHAPSFIRGVSNIRGSVMVILDLADKFELDTKNNEDKKFVLVTHSDEFKAGVLVDEVPVTLKVSGDSIVSSSGILKNTSLDETYIKGLIKTEEGMIIFIDIAELIKEDEVSVVSGSIMG